MSEMGPDDEAKIDEGERVARVCRRGRSDQQQRLAQDWPDLARALGKLMREHSVSRPAGW